MNGQHTPNNILVNVDTESQRDLLRCGDNPSWDYDVSLQ